MSVCLCNLPPTRYIGINDCKINELIFLYLNQDRKIKLTMECQWEIHVVVISRLLWRSLRCTLGLPYTNAVHIRKPPAAHINLAKIL